ncbi:MAG: NUDIX hydrolase [Catenulispora sp.]|nr:NUDIX hydrolase [Catenulispora sp.]NUR57239.1 NUDIX hydrolase [Catenulispora sp.]
MPVPADHIRAVFDAYLAAHPDQANYLKPAVELLDADADLTSRDNPIGHVTASAIVQHDGRFLAIAHKKYSGLRLQPGGHIEADKDWTLYGAALRELGEEAGVRDVKPVDTAPIHIGVHHLVDIPGEHDHIHVDFRFGYTTIVSKLRHDADETDGAAWLDLDDIENASFRAGADALLLALKRQASEFDADADAAHRGPGIPMGVYLILRDAAGRLLVGLRSDKVGVSPEMWAVPCGAREFDESAHDALVREAYEELGITVKGLRHVATGDVINSYGPTTAMYFTAESFDGQVENREPALCRGLAWVEPGAPLPVPFVEHVETILNLVDASGTPGYTAIGWANGAATAGAR